MLLRIVSISAILGVVHVPVVQCCFAGGPLVLRARATMLRADNTASPASGVIGFVEFLQIGNVVTITGSVSGLTPGLHGFHVHENGNVGMGCLAAGGHYNPFSMAHGAPTDAVRHVGDLGNIITLGADTPIFIMDTVISLSGEYSVVGRALVIHEAGDDLNRGLSPLSAITGNAGGRVSCGIIELV
ncbi:hypothetical protein KIN20_033866 [Parelaphostrongylus tenuis]|uniref:Superoxide dismutase [Cu-Zn] n=1 Tax=Parelaphostrongylus tenuis TaxID=148309 RepID=A0AAD5R9G0_PARTN|nr:hypothetical protein KIN20_033866 [Parelaphostrongylus tenuis]